MKKPFSDIVPPEGRSIRKVTVSKQPRRRTEEPHVEEAQVPSSADAPLKNKRSGNRASRIGLWVIALVAVAVLAFGVSIIFSGAKVVVTPKQRTVLVDAQFSAFQNPAVNELGYEVMTIEKEGSEEVTATGEAVVNEKASGRITIYNDYNSSSQRLIKNTRFETPEGLVYRINESVTVPGQRNEGGTTVPGSIEVTVYADEEGAGHNIGLSDFTIPGFKGDPRFEHFYARSKTAMSGGFSGNKKVVSTSDESTARAKIQSSLKDQLTREALSQKPEGFELFTEGLFVIYEPLSDLDRGGKVAIREKAVLYGVLFEKEAFAQFIARETVAGFDEESVRILDASTLTFSVLDKGAARPWIDDNFGFSLNGNVHIVWEFDAQSLKENLAGKAKGAFQTVLTGYTGIDEAEIVLRPFWRQTFPEKAENIKVTSVIHE